MAFRFSNMVFRGSAAIATVIPLVAASLVVSGIQPASAQRPTPPATPATAGSEAAVQQTLATLSYVGGVVQNFPIAQKYYDATLLPHCTPLKPPELALLEKWNTEFQSADAAFTVALNAYQAAYTQMLKKRTGAAGRSMAAGASAPGAYRAQGARVRNLTNAAYIQKNTTIQNKKTFKCVAPVPKVRTPSGETDRSKPPSQMDDLPQQPPPPEEQPDGGRSAPPSMGGKVGYDSPLLKTYPNYTYPADPMPNPPPAGSPGTSDATQQSSAGTTQMPTLSVPLRAIMRWASPAPIACRTARWASTRSRSANPAASIC